MTSSILFFQIDVIAMHSLNGSYKLTNFSLFRVPCDIGSDIYLQDHDLILNLHDQIFG